jgi:hypothetical protein
MKMVVGCDKIGHGFRLKSRQHNQREQLLGPMPPRSWQVQITMPGDDATTNCSVPCRRIFATNTSLLVGDDATDMVLDLMSPRPRRRQTAAPGRRCYENLPGHIQPLMVLGLLSSATLAMPTAILRSHSAEPCPANQGIHGSGVATAAAITKSWVAAP